MGTFRLAIGVATFLPTKFQQWPNARVLKSGCKLTQITQKKKNKYSHNSQKSHFIYFHSWGAAAHLDPSTSYIYVVGERGN